jgi:hypothetical protein
MIVISSDSEKSFPNMRKISQSPLRGSFEMTAAGLCF